MMKLILMVVFISLFTTIHAQYTTPRLEAYIAPGLFFAQLSNDALVPPARQNQSRLGDVVSFAMQLAVPLKNQHFTLKGGAGFSQRHYSLNKYGFEDFFVFVFGLPRTDSFNLSYVRFTNNYLQIPLSCSYTVTNPSHRFHLAFGVNLRNDFLVGRKAQVIFDSAYKIPQPGDIIAAKDIYTGNASTFVFTAESFIEGSFPIHKNLGMLMQFRPFSFYSSPLDKRLTKSTVELFSFTFGAFYKLK